MIATSSEPESRIAVLDATIEQIARNGARDLRVEQVAESVGVPTSLIYRHFGDRSRLLRLALLHIGARADDYTRPSPGTGREMLVEMLTAEIQERDDVRVNSAAWSELRDSNILDSSVRDALSQLTEQWVSDIAEVVERGHQDGSIDRAIGPRSAGVTLTALVEGLSARWLANLTTTDDARAQLRTGIDDWLARSTELTKGYVIFTQAVTDAQQMDAYAEASAQTLRGCGGRVIVAHDDPDVIEGAWHGTRTVIIEFPSVGAAWSWYESPAYEDARILRGAAADSNAVIVGGDEMTLLGTSAGGR